MLTARERITNYHYRLPQYSPLVLHNGRIYGFWLIGRWYASDRSYYGSYPPGYLKRVKSLFPDCHKILHLFSGTLKGDGVNEVTFDIAPTLEPNICGDARKLEDYFGDDEFDLVLADPPYEEADFRRYGCEPFDKKEVIKKCQRIVKLGGFLVWLDTRMPQFSKRYWEVYGIIGLVQSTNHRVRAITIFRKPQQMGMELGEDGRL